jgi:hypothetical protein
MRILLVLLFVVLVAGFLIVYSGSVWRSRINAPTQISTSSENSVSPHSIFAPVYSVPHAVAPLNPMATPSDFKGPSSSSTIQMHGPSGPPPGN